MTFQEFIAAGKANPARSLTGLPALGHRRISWSRICSRSPARSSSTCRSRATPKG
jgi:hypothetical protein